jgi:hypothetical protein
MIVGSNFTLQAEGGKGVRSYFLFFIGFPSPNSLSRGGEEIGVLNRKPVVSEVEPSAI